MLDLAMKQVETNNTEKGLKEKEGEITTLISDIVDKYVPFEHMKQ